MLALEVMKKLTLSLHFMQTAFKVEVAGSKSKTCYSTTIPHHRGCGHSWGYCFCFAVWIQNIRYLCRFLSADMVSSLLFFILDQLIVIYSIIHHDVSAETTSAFLRCIASFNLRKSCLFALSRIFTLSHLIGWCSVQACSAIADLSNDQLWHASLCSLILVPSLLMVSPMYTFPHVQGISYTMPECSSMGNWYLTFVSLDLKVGADLKMVFIPCCRHTLVISSLIPWTYGMNTFISSVCDTTNRQDLLRLKEAMHIQLKDEGERVNRDIGTAVPYCWIAMLKLL